MIEMGKVQNRGLITAETALSQIPAEVENRGKKIHHFLPAHVCVCMHHLVMFRMKIFPKKINFTF